MYCYYRVRAGRHFNALRAKTAEHNFGFFFFLFEYVTILAGRVREVGFFFFFVCFLFRVYSFVTLSYVFDNRAEYRGVINCRVTPGDANDESARDLKTTTAAAAATAK